jgi:hypothetical protein
VQAEDVGEALAGVQPQVQADAQVAGAVAGQMAGGQEGPGGERRHDEHDGQGDGELVDHRGFPFWAARTALRRAVRAAPALRLAWGRQVGADPGDAVQRDRGERPMPFGHQSQEPGRLGRLPRVRRGGRPGPGGDRAFGQDPGAEAGQGGGGGQGQAEQPEDQAAEEGQQGGRLVSQVLAAGQGRGADDADEGVAR